MTNNQCEVLQQQLSLYVAEVVAAELALHLLPMQEDACVPVTKMSIIPIQQLCRLGQTKQLVQQVCRLTQNVHISIEHASTKHEFTFHASSEQGINRTCRQVLLTCRRAYSLA